MTANQSLSCWQTTIWDEYVKIHVAGKSRIRTSLRGVEFRHRATDSSSPNCISDLVASSQLMILAGIALQGSRPAQIEGVRVASRLRGRRIGCRIIQ